jgi:hypothetical protein
MSDAITKDMVLTVEQKLHYLTLSQLLLNSELYEKRVQFALVFALECIEEKAKVGTKE